MNTVLQRAGWLVAAIVSLVALAAVAGIVHGGPLDPPGPPTSTSGVLRPGTPITSLPYTISQPGYYYVTRNLTMATSGDGIIVQASNVTLDLSGFTIDGGNVGRDGVTTETAGSLSDFTVENGNATRWTRTAFALADTTSSVDHITANKNVNGIEMFGIASNCAAISDSGFGVKASFSTLTNCEGSADGTGFALFASTLRGCEADSNTTGITAERSTVETCTLTQNTGDGIVVAASSGAAPSTVRDNTIIGSGGNGITLNGGGAMVDGNSIRSSTGSGIYVPTNDNRIHGNVSSGNSGEGLDILGSYNTVDGNTGLQNSDYGIFVALGTKNTIILNSATGNRASSDQQNYLIASGQNAGPIVAASSATNPLSNTQ